MYEDYKPAPIDTTDIKRIPRKLRKLIEVMAENVHEVWAQEKIDAGWKYGPSRDSDNRTHPCLVPYKELPESEKKYDRDAAIETIKLMYKLGFDIKK